MTSRPPTVLRASRIGVVLITMLTSAQAAAQTYDINAETHRLTGSTGAPAPGEAIEVVLTFKDPVTGSPVTENIDPQAWLRTSRPNSLPCVEAVGAYRLRMVSNKEVSALTGQLLAVVGNDATVSFVDRQVNLATANILSIARLDEMPSKIVDLRGEVAALLPESGRVVVADISGAVRELASGLVDPTAIAVQGNRLIVGDSKGIVAVGADGTRHFSTAIEEGIASILPVDGAMGTPGLLAASASGGLYELDAATGTLRRVLDMQVSAAAASGSAIIVASGRKKSVWLAYASDLGRRIGIDLPFEPVSVVADNRGRYAVALDGAMKDAALIDLQRGRIADRFGLPAPAAQAIFSDGSLFVAHRDSADLTMVDTTTIITSSKAAIRTYSITGSAPTRLAPDLGGKGRVIAIPANGRAALMFGNGNPAAPLHSYVLRGARPELHLALDRSFRAQSDGTFRAIGRVPEKGPVELVAVGANNVARCFAVASTAPLAAEDPRLVFDADGPVVVGQPIQVRVRFEGAVDQALQDLATLPLVVGDLNGRRADFDAVAQGDGSYSFTLTLPAAGPYHVTVAAYDGVTPAWLEVK